MAEKKSKRQSPSSQRWHSGIGRRKKDLRVFKSSKGAFKSVADLEAHRLACARGEKTSRRAKRAERRG